jgi:hypothetical protein
MSYKCLTSGTGVSLAWRLGKMRKLEKHNARSESRVFRGTALRPSKLLSLGEIAEI